MIDWCEGKSGVGPRAIGHRSLVDNPRYKDNWKRVNKIKEREWWRPFTPSLLEEEEWGWTTNFAFAVKPTASDDPEQTNTNGEWVNARFTGSDGAVYEEWYQIADSKLIWWSSAKRETGFPPPPPVE